MTQRTRSNYERLRYWLTTAASHVPPIRGRSIFVLGYPRTGTNWVCRILSHYFELPIYISELSRLPSFRPAVLHLHRFFVPRERTIYMLRDGRDSLVSYYFKLLNSVPEGAPTRARLQEYCPQPLSHDNLRENLPGFTRYLFEAHRKSSIPYPEHVREARRRGLHSIRYEDLRQDGEKAVSSAVSFLSGSPADPDRVREALEATSFEKRSGRQIGDEDVHHPTIRKGIVGDWKNHFTPESARLFDQYAGDALIECGYEPDHSWVERVADAAD
jgi:hypothetical protein